LDAYLPPTVNQEPFCAASGLANKAVASLKQGRFFDSFGRFSKQLWDWRYDFRQKKLEKKLAF
jgi:hypothetical protein